MHPLTKEPVDIVIQSEKCAIAQRCDIIGDIATGEPPICDRNRDLGNRDDVSIHPGYACGQCVLHRQLFPSTADPTTLINLLH